MSDTAKECGMLQMKNIVALGMSVALLGFARDPFVAAIAEQFGGKAPEVVAANVRAFTEGARLVDEQQGDTQSLGRFRHRPKRICCL